MKKLLIALCFIGSVHAKEVAWMPNQGSGKIVLTDEVCKDYKTGKTYSGLLRMFSYLSDGYTIEGCYYFSDSLVNGIWINGDERKYEINNFYTYEKKSGTNL